jgi:uncharacterized protein (TIGR02246 family)
MPEPFPGAGGRDGVVEALNMASAVRALWARARRSSALLLLVLSTLDCAKAPPPAEATIRETLARQAEAWNRHDARAWVAPFSDDAEFVNILGTTLQGRAEIERRHAEIFGGIFAHSHVQVKTRRVRRLGTSAALAETEYELRGYDRLPPGIRATDADGTLRTLLKYVWALDHDEWKVVAAQNTAILPPPSKP